jgi:hypothetical protein
MREKASIWTSPETAEFAEVDNHHKAQNQPGVDEASMGDDGIPGEKKAGYLDFGHNMLQYWCFEDGCEYDQEYMGSHD